MKPQYFLCVVWKPKYAKGSSLCKQSDSASSALPWGMHELHSAEYLLVPGERRHFFSRRDDLSTFTDFNIAVDSITAGASSTWNTGDGRSSGSQNISVFLHPKWLKFVLQAYFYNIFVTCKVSASYLIRTFIYNIKTCEYRTTQFHTI